MLMPFNEEESGKLERVARKLGKVELLGQCSEECAELIQAAQKMRRVLCKTTPVGSAEAMENLTEEAADVLVCLEALITSGLFEYWEVMNLARKKIDRWHERTFAK